MNTNSALTARETAMARILADVESANISNVNPSKADLTRSLPTATRARRYQQIDRLIARGLLANEGEPNKAYKLAITDAGRAAVDEFYGDS